MNELLKLGISEQEIKNMLEVNSEILELTDEDVQERIRILCLEECNEKIVRNIVQANPLYLSRSCEDINKLIYKLKSLGIMRLDVTFDSNPWLLNYDDYEINNFIIKKREAGLEMDEIIDLIDQGMVE